MTIALNSVLKTISCLGVLAVLSACGGGIHSMGVSQSCDTAAVPYLSGQAGVPVRCNPQSQSPSGLTQ